MILLINHERDDADVQQMALRPKSVSWRSSIPMKKTTWQLSFKEDSGPDPEAASKENSTPGKEDRYLGLDKVDLVVIINIYWDGCWRGHCVTDRSLPVFNSRNIQVLFFSRVNGGRKEMEPVMTK